MKLQTEDFGVKRIETFLNLQNLSSLPVEVKTALAEKETVIFRYIEGLKQFSTLCEGNNENFYITHGDARGNCILNKDQLSLVDWDSVMLAPIERDARIFICRKNEIKKINSILVKNGIDYVLEQNRLCYYCYDFFFYYLNEYLKSIIDAESGGRKKNLLKV